MKQFFLSPSCPYQRRNGLALIFAFVFLYVAQLTAFGQTFEPSYGAPSTPLQVCGEDAEFRAKINSGGTAINNVTLRVTLPTGYAYTDGSAEYVSGGSGSITDTQVSSNINIYDLTINIPASGSVELKYRAAATCAVIGSTGSGFVSYTLVSGTGTPELGSNITGSSGAVNFENAKLVIESVTNQNYSGAAGSTYTRDITIKNTGYGSITGINLTSNNSTGFTISSPSVVSTTGTGSTALVVSGTAPNQTYTVSGVTLAQNQQIVIRENVQITSCTGSLTTSYDAWFGCTNKCTQNGVNGTQTAGASVTTDKPNIVYNSGSAVSPPCRGTDQVQTFSYRNAGPGIAKNILVTLASNTAGATNTSVSSVADIIFQSGFKNLQYQIGVTTGAWTPLTTTGNVYPDASVSQNCLTSANAPIRTQATLPDLASGQIIYIRYTEVTCCPNYCATRSLTYPNTVVQIGYSDPCGDNYTTDARKLRGIGDGTSSLLGNDLPSDMVAGQSYDFNWNIGISGPNATYNNGTVKMVVTLPAGTVAPTISQVSILLSNGTTLVPDPATFSVVGNQLTATFNVSGSLSTLNLAQFKLSNITATCDGVTGNTSINVSMYASQPSCGCESQIACTSTPIGTHCNPCPRGGLAFKNFSVKRITYGLPDANNDGTPDGTLDVSKLRTDYVMDGDILEAIQYGEFVGAIASNVLPTLTNAYVKNTFSTAVTSFSSVSATVEIYVAGSSTPTYTTTSSVPITYASGTGTADISIDKLHAAGVPSSYTAFATGDKIVVKTYYKVVNGRANEATNIAVNMSNSMYASNIENPTDANDIYYCDSFGGNFRLFYYSEYFGSYTPDVVAVCGTVTANPFYSFTFGERLTAVSNYFPYEVRRTAFTKTFTVTIPAGFTYQAARVASPSFANQSNTQVAISPVNASANPLVFDLEPLFNAGTLKWSDEAFSTSLAVDFTVECNTPSGNTTVPTVVTQDESANSLITLKAADSPFNVNRAVTYRPGVMVMSSSQAIVTTTSNTVSWVVAIQNGNSGTDIAVALPNTWLARQASSGMTITSVEALGSASATSGTVVSPTAGGIYQLGELAGNSTTKYYKITASLSNCSTSNLSLAYGYACSAYPSNVDAALCKNNFTLTAQVQPLSLQLTVIDQPGAAERYDLCDEVDYEVEVLNPSEATGTDLQVIATKPSSGGIAYEPNSFQVLIPGGGSFVSVPDANVNNTATQIVFTIPASTFASLEPSQTYRVKFKVRTTACEFVSGSSLRFRPAAEDACGNTKLGDNKQSNPIRLNGAPESSNTFTITSDVQSVTTCGNGAATTNYHYKMVNNNAATAILYNFEIEMPAPWEMASPSTLSLASGSYTGVGYTGVTTNVAGNKVYSFSVASGMASGAYVEFTEPITALNASSLSCGLSEPIREAVTLVFSSTCSVDNTVCDSKELVTEHDGTQIEVSRPDYSITNITAAKSGQNAITGTVTITNSSTAYVGQNATLQLYKDADNSGTYTTGDVLLGSQSFSVTSGTSNTYNYSVTSGYSGNICPIVAVVDFECSCTPSASYAYACDITFPVHLASFTVKADGTSALLNWSTSMELNNAYFVVEHSTNAISFEGVGKVAGKGTTQSLQTYSFSHDNLSAASIHYYRLKQVDSDGTYQYSIIRSVQLDGYVGIDVRVNPNPTTDRIVRVTLDYGDESLSKQVVCKLVSLQGQELGTQTIELQKGRNEVRFDAHGLSTGTYVLRVENASLKEPRVVKVMIR